MTLSDAIIPPVTKQIVFVCGSLHYDVVVGAPHLPRQDETVVGSNVNYVCGGKGGNQAVAASLNGATTAFAGCIGADEFGDQLSKHLQKNKIDCSRVQTVEGASGMSVAIVDSNGDYGAVIVSAANLHTDGSAIEFPDNTGILVLQNEIPVDVNIELAQHAKKLDVPIMLNAAPYRTLTAKLENLIDILVLNRVEAEQFFDKRFEATFEVATTLEKADTPIKTVIVTLGSSGLVYRNSAGQVHIKSAYSVVVNSTHGAGDMFCGSLASRVIRGDVSSDALDYAMAAAACHVSASPENRLVLHEYEIQKLLNTAK